MRPTSIIPLAFNLGNAVPEYAVGMDMAAHDPSAYAAYGLGIGRTANELFISAYGGPGKAIIILPKKNLFGT